jgi:hypothetical protein
MTELLSRTSWRPRVELRRPRPLDLVIVAAGALALAFSFFSYYTVTIQNVSSTTSAWHGFWGWFGALLAAVAALLVAVGWLAAAGPPPLSYGGALVLFAAAIASTLVALFQEGYDTSGPRAYALRVDNGHGYGYWVSLGAVVVGAVASLIRLRQAAAAGR